MVTGVESFKEWFEGTEASMQSAVERNRKIS